MVLGAEEVLIGRGKECQVVLLADEVSRRHTRIAWEGGVHVVSDLGSSNGTFVNGDAVQKPRKLDHDDLVTVGPFRLRYLLVEGTKEELGARFDPRITDTTRAMKGPSKKEAQLAGSFSGAVLLEACQLIELSKRTG
jgi:pSer/pThr/pTyr-binding forkhead associated (FHA) protein